MNHISIQVPQPCHESWSEMVPNGKGRFCASCSKTVVDYTVYSDQELIKLLGKSTRNLCGRFYNDQLTKPLAAPNSDRTPLWRHWIRLLTMSLFSWQAAQAQSGQFRSPPQSVSVRLNEPIKPLSIRNSINSSETWNVSDRILSMNSGGHLLTVPKATVSITRLGQRWQTEADSVGTFSVPIMSQLSDVELTVWVAAPNHLRGKATFTITSSTKSVVLNDIILYESTPTKNVTAGGIVIVQTPSRWQKLTRKLFC